ncbi:unnamed protein product [Enterobius vermicularis]|uniref:ZP domain-containing protein n=1 Tax=Enterobius vermicularis TaxID=51028 RepID=A0A0N4UZE8_ENTVE|nr:unnamed protein product [Enterobius vermicularis]
MHPLFATESDRSYCAHCVYTESREELVDIYLQDLLVSKNPPFELAPQFDESMTKPKCTYEIRRGSIDGPPIRYAMLGEVVYHRWECSEESIFSVQLSTRQQSLASFLYLNPSLNCRSYNEKVQANTIIVDKAVWQKEIHDYGLLVQNCYVENGESERILVIDENGCGVDQYIIPTPQYSSDLTKAWRPPRNCPINDEQELLTKKYGGVSSVKNYNAISDGPGKFHLDGTVSDKISEENQRHRRNQNESLRLKPNAETYPEMDVVGVLTVLDSPDDVEYYGLPP